MEDIKNNQDQKDIPAKQEEIINKDTTDIQETKSENNAKETLNNQEVQLQNIQNTKVYKIWRKICLWPHIFMAIKTIKWGSSQEDKGEAN